MSLLMLVATAVLTYQAKAPAQMDALKPFHGEWHGDVQIKPPASPGFGGPAVWKISPVMDGLYLQVELQHEISGMGVVRGLTYLSWDKDAGKYRSFTFSNNPSELGKPRNELVDLKEQALVYPLSEGGPDVKWGQAFELQKDGTMKFVMRMVQGAKETVIASGVLKRK